jgi:hypothetical protein
LLLCTFAQQTGASDTQFLFASILKKNPSNWLSLSFFRQNYARTMYQKAGLVLSDDVLDDMIWQVFGAFDDAGDDKTVRQNKVDNGGREPAKKKQKSDSPSRVLPPEAAAAASSSSSNEQQPQPPADLLQRIPGMTRSDLMQELTAMKIPHAKNARKSLLLEKVRQAHLNRIIAHSATAASDNRKDEQKSARQRPAAPFHTTTTKPYAVASSAPSTLIDKSSSKDHLDVNGSEDVGGDGGESIAAAIDELRVTSASKKSTAGAATSTPVAKKSAFSPKVSDDSSILDVYEYRASTPPKKTKTTTSDDMPTGGMVKRMIAQKEQESANKARPPPLSSSSAYNHNNSKSPVRKLAATLAKENDHRNYGSSSYNKTATPAMEVECAKIKKNAPPAPSAVVAFNKTNSNKTMEPLSGEDVDMVETSTIAAGDPPRPSVQPDTTMEDVYDDENAPSQLYGSPQEFENPQQSQELIFFSQQDSQPMGSPLRHRAALGTPPKTIPEDGEDDVDLAMAPPPRIGRSASVESMMSDSEHGAYPTKNGFPTSVGKKPTNINSVETVEKVTRNQHEEEPPSSEKKPAGRLPIAASVTATSSATNGRNMQEPRQSHQQRLVASMRARQEERLQQSVKAPATTAFGSAAAKTSALVSFCVCSAFIASAPSSFVQAASAALDDVRRAKFTYVVCSFVLASCRQPPRITLLPCSKWLQHPPPPKLRLKVLEL